MFRDIYYTNTLDLFLTGTIPRCLWKGLWCVAKFSFVVIMLLKIQNVQPYRNRAGCFKPIASSSIKQKQTRFQFVFQNYFPMSQKFAITPKMLWRANWLSGNLMWHEFNQWRWKNILPKNCRVEKKMTHNVYGKNTFWESSNEGLREVKL